MGRRRRLGQHFLRDRGVAKYIAELVPEGSTVIEVGPGEGVLTFELAKRARKIYAIELDPVLAASLAARAPPNVEVIRGDALKVPWPPADYFASNMPYYITSPLLMKLAEAHLPAVVMVQREVAERLAAEPGSAEYGRLTVAIRCKYSVDILRVVPPWAFRPPPKVYSAIVRLTPRPPCVDDFAAFQRFTARLFSQRRRLVKKLCGDVGVDKRVYQLTVEEVAEIFRRCRY